MSYYYKCPVCGRCKESEDKVVLCNSCANVMKKIIYQSCTQVEIKNPYPHTDIYGQVVEI